MNYFVASRGIMCLKLDKYNCLYHRPLILSKVGA